MRTTYIISVGVSILQRYEKLKCITEENIPSDLREWLRKANRDDQNHIPSIICEALDSFGQLTSDRLSRLSAELQPLLSIRPRPKKQSPIYLVCSDTDLGYLAAQIVRLILKHIVSFKEIFIRRATGMKLNVHEINDKGMPELFRMVSEIRAEEAGSNCIIIASGGWKPLSTLLTFAGMFFQIPVYYAYLDSEVLELPEIYWQYDSSVFDMCDIRILCRLYREKHLEKSLWNRLPRRGGDIQQLKFLIDKVEKDTDFVEISRFGTIVLATYLGERQDKLTKLFKKEVFEETVNYLLPGKERRRNLERRTVFSHCQGYCLAFADIDNLKKFNETYGHSRTDDVIKEIAIVLADSVFEQPGSFAARRSGDEFWLLFESNDFDSACSVLEKTCQKVKEIRISGIKLPTSVSIAGIYVSKQSQTSWKACEKRLEELHQRLKSSKDLKGTALCKSFPV